MFLVYGKMVDKSGRDLSILMFSENELYSAQEIDVFLVRMWQAPKYFGCLLVLSGFTPIGTNSSQVVIHQNEM